MALGAPRRRWIRGELPLHPFLLKRRMPGPGRKPLGTLFELRPPRRWRGHLFELRVSAWLRTLPPAPHDRYLAPFAHAELRLARRLALQLGVRWEDNPLTGLPHALAIRVRWLRAAQLAGRRAVVAWLLDAERLPQVHRERQREQRWRRRMRELQVARLRGWARGEEARG